MTDLRVLIVTKTSMVDLLGDGEILNRLRDRAGAFFRDIDASHREHENSLMRLRSILESLNIRYDLHLRDTQPPDLSSYNLLISAGGDGTFLYTSHIAGGLPVLGVNTSPGSSVGFYCHGVASAQLEQRLLAIRDENQQPTAFSRLQVLVNGTPVGPLILNDILICESNPGATSKYILHVPDGPADGEYQKSSGIWIASHSGQTAAYRSAGGAPFADRESFAFVVRELYRAAPDSLQQGVIPGHAHVRIASAMADGRMYLDGSHHVISVGYGDSVEIRQSGSPLYIF